MFKSIFAIGLIGAAAGIVVYANKLKVAEEERKEIEWVPDMDLSLQEEYTKIWDEAHKYAYGKWAELLVSSLDSDGKIKMTRAVCDSYNARMKASATRDGSYYEWHPEVNGCVEYPAAFTNICDTIAEQYNQPKDYFTYVPPEFECKEVDGLKKCTMKRLPTCSVPKAYCEQQLAMYRENPETCAGECYTSDVTDWCGYIVGDVMCRALGNESATEIGKLLAQCNMNPSAFGCQVPDGFQRNFDPNKFNPSISVERTSFGYLRPKNLWDTRYANQMTLNPKSAAATDNSIISAIRRQPWFLLGHDNDFKGPMAIFGHYFRVPGFKFYEYIEYLNTVYKGVPASDDNHLHIYTIDLVNFSDWASDISACKPLDVLIRMLTQVMITNFRMRSFNTLAVNGEIWADKTKIFNTPFEFRKRGDTFPNAVDSRLIDYERQWRFKNYRPAVTDVVLMKWPANFVFGKESLGTLVQKNLPKIQSALFSVGAFFSATKCVDDWDSYKSMTPEQRNASFAFMCILQEKATVDGVDYPEVRTKIESQLILENRSLIVRVTVTPVVVK
jgi:hypothetical protein